MKTILTSLSLLFIVFVIRGQDTVTGSGRINAAEKMSAHGSKLTIGGYAQVDFNQTVDQDQATNGKMDVHRLVLLVGYKFTDRIQFISEIELEHVNEIFVEQAFINYKVTDWLNFKAGLILVPMGIINEYHEPPTFNGVERPNVDYYIIPTTWREIGAGITGNIRPARMKYQLYMINGFISYDGEARLNGKSGFRNGRQKGIESIFRYPNLAGKVEYYGVKGLNLGLSGYFGKSQSNLYKGIPREGLAMQTADSSVVGTAMLGVDARYAIKGIILRAQFNYGSFTNVEEYNAFTGSDFGKAMTGFYVEAAYDVFSPFEDIKGQLIPFIRYENYNTQSEVIGTDTKNPAWHREEIIAGVGWKPVPGIAVKADYQFYRTWENASFSQQFNAGIGVWF